jgi:hypothetical protein
MKGSGWHYLGQVSEMKGKRDLPQLAVRAINEGVVARERWSRPISGAPSEPLNEDPEPETHRYLVETVWDRKRWKSEIVEPWLMQTVVDQKIYWYDDRNQTEEKIDGRSRFLALCLFLLGLLMTLIGRLGNVPMTFSGSSPKLAAEIFTSASTFFFFSSTSEM